MSQSAARPASAARTATARTLPRDPATACAYCHLPVPDSANQADVPAYCCFGCRLAAEITGQTGAQGAVHWTLARLGLAIFLSINVMMFTMALWTQDVNSAAGAASNPLATTLAELFRYLCLVLSLPVLFLLGGPILESALADWRRGGADLLIVVGVASAYVYSAVSVFRGTGHVYFEVGCGVLVMVTLGRWLEANGKLRTTEALDALEKLLPETVRVRQPDGRETIIAIGDVQLGDLLHVVPGERIPTDGRLLTGCAAVDEHMLTGESRPASRQPGDILLGGSLNLDGNLTMAVTALAGESSLARVVELVRRARQTKGRFQRAADRVARWFLPVVIAIAGLTFAIHTARGGIDAGLLAALAVLLIACPCALGLATPMAVWTALGTASRAGVLVRDGESLERLATIRALRFDKTGTLTTGTPRLSRFVAAEPELRQEILRRAARLSGGSTHAFSAAIAVYAADQTAPNDATSEDAVDHVDTMTVETSPGEGICARFPGQATTTRLGSPKWLAETCPQVSQEIREAIQEAASRGEPLAAIGWDQQVRGVFVFSETLRPEAAESLRTCAQRGYDVAVLTGDHAASARALAAALHVPVFAELLPDDKVAALARARDKFGPVAMIGDGINDAPALAASDLGIAMGCGADVSRESAAVCLVSNHLALVPWTLDLAQRTRRTIRQNLFWAFGYNSVGIGLAAAGWLNPAWAAAAMVASSLLVVSNSLRLNRIAPSPASELDTATDPYESTTVPRRESPALVGTSASG